MNRIRIAALLAGLVLAIPALADSAIRVTNAWARATLPGQKVAGAYLEITSPMDGRLTGVSSPAAGSAEVHSMKMDNGVMKMRPVESLDLPAGKMVKLEPGGLHVMLFDLKKPLRAGQKVPLVLAVELPNNIRREVNVTLLVRNSDEEAGGHEHH